MTWGSNCTGKRDTRCPWCNSTMVDDRDTWPTTHMEYRCRKRTLWNRFWYWWTH